MRLFRLTFSTIFRRKSWFIALLLVCVLPFGLSRLSSGTENPALMKPALAQATWGMAWIAAMLWSLFTAAAMGHRHSESGMGEYFLAQGQSRTRQLGELWLANVIFVLPLALGPALVAIAGASPSLADERSMWIALNFQYTLLFLITFAPLVMLAIALASRFGNICGFVLPLALTLYGLYGVGYLQDLAQKSPILQSLVDFSPHYHLADLTPRLRYKLGAIEWSEFPVVLAYFGGLFLVFTGLSRCLFRAKITA